MASLQLSTAPDSPCIYLPLTLYSTRSVDPYFLNYSLTLKRTPISESYSNTGHRRLPENHL